MSVSISVPFWPATLDCVRWSPDNLITVAGSDSVAILIPRLKTRVGDEATWDVEVLKVNAFTIKEMPLIDPISFTNWSLGQELSQRYVQSLAWSQPGPGRFDTSVLAILHSDFTLAIWEYRGRPGTKENWNRCLTVTRAIHDHYVEQGTQSEALSVKARARAMAWAGRGCGLSTRPGLQYIAVATEAGDILLIEVCSPYDILRGERTQWVANVRYSISCTSYLPMLDHALHPHTATDNDCEVIDALTWSYDARYQHHNFVFLASRGIYHARWRPPTDGADASVSISLLSDSLIQAEPPLRSTSGGDSVLYIAGDTVVARTLAHPTSHAISLQRRWSDVAGLAVMPSSRGFTRAYPALHLSFHRQQAEAMTFPIDSGDHQSAGITTALLDDVKIYNRKLELGGGVKTYAWGVDRSPSGLEVACCCSMLPADSAAHLISSDQTSTVYIGSTAQLDAEEIAFEEHSTQSLLFVIQARHNSLGDEVDDLSETAAGVAIHNFVSSLPDQYAARLTEDMPNDVKELTLRILLHPERLHDIQERLSAIAFTRPYRTSLPQTWYLALIHYYEAMYATSQCPGMLSKRIMSIYSTVRAKLTQDSTVSSDERCGICDGDMSFEALKWARCASGHRFARCALTLLAITQPGTSKSCSACGSQYLHEQHLPELGPVDDAGSGQYVESSCSPARVLFTAVYTCILCHGKFTS